MPFWWRECCETQQQVDSASRRDTFRTELTFCLCAISPPGCVLTYVYVHAVREALVHRLSLKVLELGEWGGERQEERDSVPILAHFSGFSWLPPLSTQLKSKVWSVVSDSPNGVIRSVYESPYSPSPWQIGVYLPFKGHTAVHRYFRL